MPWTIELDLYSNRLVALFDFCETYRAPPINEVPR